jgi:hypothetical protein
MKFWSPYFKNQLFDPPILIFVKFWSPILFQGQFWWGGFITNDVAVVKFNIHLIPFFLELLIYLIQYLLFYKMI